MKINKAFLLLILISYYFRGIQGENQPKENIKHNNEEQHHEQKIPFGSPEFFLYILYSLIFAGMMSGLTVGYSSIDPLHLEILHINGSDEQKKQAARIEPIIEKKHLMLATLLLSNALAMESLPIFLDAIMPATLAIILSTTVVLIFGEVVPQALCLGENQIQIAAQLSPFISCLIKVLYPICYPISLALDYFLGHGEGKVRFKKKDLKAIIELHQIKQNPANEGFTADEINIINSVIDIRNVKVEQIMVPLENLFKVYEDEIITKDLIKRIQDKNFSRIPVFSRKNYCLGFMKTKTVLIIMQQNLGQQIKTLQRTNKVQFVARNTNLLEAIEIMHRENMSLLLIATDIVNLGVSRIQRSRNNMKVGEKDLSGILGLVFLKDIFEELIKREIDDEDLHYDSTAQHYGRPNTQVPRIDMSEPQEMKEYEKEPLLQNEYDQILYKNFFSFFLFNLKNYLNSYSNQSITTTLRFI